MRIYPAGKLDVACPADLPEHTGEHLDDGAQTLAEITHNNSIRAGFASTGVKAFARRVGIFQGENLETAISDFLGDLMHLCDALDIPFEAMVDRGAFHHDAELRGD